MQRVFLAALIVIGCLNLRGFAQTAPTTPSASHVAAAHDLLDAMKLRTTLVQMVNSMLDQQVAANPQIAPYKQIMSDFMKKHMSFDTLKPEFARLYAEEFTEPELKELAAFYRTPTGAKMANKLVVLTQKGAQIGQRRVQQHLPELQQAIMQAAQQQQGQQQPAPTPPGR